jgi:RNA polymerase sigma-70 factor (ECF subfamily)
MEEATRELLSRVADNRSLDLLFLIPRVRKVVDKYLLRDDANASDKAILSFVEGLQAEDLCLVVACERGDQSAWEELVQRFSVTVRSAARSASPNEDAAEELAQSIWAELHGLRSREDGIPAGKLAYYSGRGSLAGWLRAVVAQLAVDHHRKQSRLVQTEEDSEFDRLAQDDKNYEATASTIMDPEKEITNKFAANEIRMALADAVEKLADEDRLLVKLYYFDELKLREAGAVLGVHEATASRRLTKIQNELRNSVQRFLVEKHGWTKAEAERNFAEVALHLEADLETMVNAPN